MKKIMIVAGGKWQIPIVRKAKELGLYVLCTNLYPESPAFCYADEAEVSDVLDIERNLQIAQNFMPDAIVTDQSDIAVRTVAYLNEQLNLKGIGCKCADLFTNKFLMREFCREHGFPIPDYKLCTNIEEAKTFFSKYNEVIIKPIDSQASRGVFKISSVKELEENFQFSLMESNRSKCVLVEQFISGIEFTVDGIMQNGVHTSLCTSYKEHFALYPNVASRLYFVNSDEKYNLKTLKEQNNQLINKMGLPFGLTHAEYILSNGKFYLVEVAARGGGTNISGKIVPIMSGIDTNEKLIRMALGEKVNIDLTKNEDMQNRCCVLQFFSFKPGYVAKIHGMDFMDSKENVLEYNFNFSVGDTISEPKDDSKRSGHYIAWANSAEELELLCKEIEQKIWVEYG